jgi:hypothetical protein
MPVVANTFLPEGNKMAIYVCECELIISTSSSNPICLRCRRTLGLSDRLRRVDKAFADTAVISLEQETSFCDTAAAHRGAVVR